MIKSFYKYAMNRYLGDSLNNFIRTSISIKIQKNKKDEPQSQFFLTFNNRN